MAPGSRLAAPALAASLAAFVAEASLASDGALEINQACATSIAGCFPGDTGGFPVTIAARGSYRLTSDLDLRAVSPNLDGVQIDAQFVTLDLGGFSIYGPVTCSGVPTTSCAPTGTGNGVNAGFYVTVRNGTVQGMAGAGVHVPGTALVEAIQAIKNGGSGIKAEGGVYVLRGNLLTSNGQHGIDAGFEATVDRNAAVGNALAGVSVSPATHSAAISSAPCSEQTSRSRTTPSLATLRLRSTPATPPATPPAATCATTASARVPEPSGTT